jgi:quinoprotein glucose dehydrogenase
MSHVGRRHARIALLGLLCGCAPASVERAEDGAAPRSAPAEWRAYGGDVLGSRYSPLTDITPENVRRLAVAWSFSTGEGELAVSKQERFAFETTPLVFDGTLFLSTPLGRVFALDPATGATRWRYDPGVDQRLRFGDFTNRGVSMWENHAAPPGARCRRAIFIATIDARLIALDAGDGTPCARFGANGVVDLRRGLRNAPFEIEEYEQTSPPAVLNGVVVVGSAIADNNRSDAVSGEVRGFDAITGALRWSWDPVPQDPADPAYASWVGPKARSTGAANAWSIIAADPGRDLVFVPTSSPSPDYYGGERLGDNRYANSIVALRASTGRVAWHFQTVHHDLWDYDNASPPALVTLRRSGSEIPVVLQATKTGQLFVLHRETGEPVFPVEERPVPASDVPGERSAATQPFSSLPPLSPHRLTPDQAFGMNEIDRQACRQRVATLRNEGIFTPPSLGGSLVMPSNVGGAHWGGVAFDPVRQIAVIPVNRLATEVQLLSREDVDSARARRRRGERLDGGWEYAAMRGTPYGMRRRIMRAESGVPCTPPPFGALVAIDLSSGEKLWEVPLGDFRAVLGQSQATGEPTGSPNLGGPIITASGLVFIAATVDRRLRAFDIRTGRELWSGELPAGARATPMTYRATAGGKQHVVIAAGGQNLWGPGDRLVAFALP